MSSFLLSDGYGELVRVPGPRTTQNRRQSRKDENRVGTREETSTLAVSMELTHVNKVYIVVHMYNQYTVSIQHHSCAEKLHTNCSLVELLASSFCNCSNSHKKSRKERKHSMIGNSKVLEETMKM